MLRKGAFFCEGTGSPEKKSFRSEHGKGMDLYPQSMGLDGGETGKITFEDETGTTIESNGGLVLMAKEGIRLESMTGIAMQGMSDIMALYSQGASSLCVNGSVDMLGRRTGLAGTVYQGYAPFEDAPQKGEFDWGGFARNLVMGLAVGAACIALAVFLPGIGAVAAGALFGAGMGAISASVAGAVSDYSSGNVRSLGEATKDTVISMITGAVTGAIGAAFPAIKWFGEGLIDVGSGILTRGMYALLNPDMSADEKLAYVFDLKQMGVDFITGVAMHFAFKGVSAVREKLPWNKGGIYSGDLMSTEEATRYSEHWRKLGIGSDKTWKEFMNANPNGTIDDYFEIVQKQSPWPLGETGTPTTLKEGDRFFMAVENDAPENLIGGFGVKERIESTDFVRNNLAVKYDWKTSCNVIREFEINSGVELKVNAGPVGPQIDLGADIYLPGSTTITQYDLFSNLGSGIKREDYVHIVDEYWVD